LLSLRLSRAVRAVLRTSTAARTTVRRLDSQPPLRVARPRTILRDKVPQHGSQRASRNKPEIIARRVSLRRTPFSSTGIPACANVTRATTADACGTRDIVLSVAQALLPASFYRTAISSELGSRITSHPMNARGQAEACPTEPASMAQTRQVLLPGTACRAPAENL